VISAGSIFWVVGPREECRPVETTTRPETISDRVPVFEVRFPFLERVRANERQRTMPREDGLQAAGWRKRIEIGFEGWGRFIYRKRWGALTTSLLLTGWLLSFLPGLTVDNSTESFLLPDDPAVLVYNEFRDQFGRDDRIILAIETPELFSFEFLARLKELHEAIESDVPNIVEVESLLNARMTRGSENELIVGELLEDWPESPADLDALREIVLSNPLYLDSLISADAKMTAIAISPATYSNLEDSGDSLGGFDDDGDDGEEGDEEGSAPSYLTDKEGEAVIEGLDRLIERFDAPEFRLHLAGALVMTSRMNSMLTSDLGVLMPAALLLMCVILALLFRRVGGVLLPVMIVVLSLMATLGIMIVLGIPGSTAVQILPVFLLTVGICDAVHILAIVYRLRMEGKSEEDSVALALGHSGFAVLMTSVTTAVGMASFLTAEMASVADLGLLAPIGIMVAFAYTMVLLPALIAIFPMPIPKTGQMATGVFPMEGALVAVGTFAARSPWRILFPTSLLIVIGILGALQIQFSHDGLSWFPETDRLRTDFTAIDESLGGSISLEVVVDSGEPGGLYEPEMMAAIERVSWEIKNIAVEPIVVRKSLSIVDIVKETHQALGENRPEMNRIPETRAAIAQELLLFENSGSEDTEDLVDTEFRKARISVRVPNVDALLFPPYIAKVKAMLAHRLGDRATFEITGLMMLLSEIFESMIRSLLRSYAFALIVITPLMMLLLGSLRRGLVSMVPNLIPVLAVLGVMGWLGIPLDMTTMMVGAMVIGIAVDDTIHFMHKFHRYFEESGDIEAAVRETMRTTGSALLFTSLVLAFGFAVFALSEMSNFRIFGLLSSLAALVAFLADILVAPALLSVVEGSRRPVETLEGFASEALPG
jgi:predicted RND superfamily exporter protein